MPKQTPGQYQQRSIDSTVAPSLQELRVTKNDSSNWQQIATIPEDKFEHYIKETKEKKKELTTSGTLKIAKEEIKKKKRKEYANKSVNYQEDNSIKIIHNDFRKVEIEPNSIDIILTDPPYSKEYLPLWKDLAIFAERNLKQNGYLITYSGQLYLNKVISYLSEHLEYCWIFALYHSGNTQLIYPRNIICEWKPILIFKKGNPGKFYDTFSDFIDIGKMNKNLHKWQQREESSDYILNHFPCKTFCDPLAGSATFLISAIRKKCNKIIGIDIDEQNIKIIKSRINDEKRNNKQTT